MASLPPPPNTSPLTQKDGTPSSTWARWLALLQSILTGEDWTPATLVNGWVNFGGGKANASFYKDGAGVVHIQGLIKLGTIGAVAFTLPAGYRPLGNLTVATNASNAFGSVDINSDGTVTPQVGANTFVSLAFSFRAEQ